MPSMTSPNPASAALHRASGFEPVGTFAEVGHKLGAWRDVQFWQLMLDAGDFAWLTRELVAIADRHADGRIVSTLEGGYDLATLAECVVAHVDSLRL